MNTLTRLKGKRAAYVTLGCKLNYAETSTIAEALRRAGALDVKRGERADICVVNTCSVTQVADSKSRQAIRRAVREHPGATVVVTGCYAQLRPEEVASIDGVSLVVGAGHKARLPELLCASLASAGQQGLPAVHADPSQQAREFFPACACGSRTRYFLKVQDGCDSFCTYCTVPFARGRSRSASVASLVRQAQDVALRGGKEIVITGVNIGDFGRATGETFLQLLQALDRVEGIARYRISSLEADLLTDEVLAFCAQSRAVMPHFHLPLQSGSDEVLRLMHRHYDTALFASRIERIRELLPDAFLGVDVIVGTRGETDQLFEASLRFVERLPVSQCHVFTYSERPGTAALKIAHSVSAVQKRERSRLLLSVSERKLQAFYERFVGSVRPVLLEHTSRRGVRSGFTDNYIKVEVPAELDNEIASVRLEGWNESRTALKGTIV